MANKNGSKSNSVNKKYTYIFVIITLLSIFVISFLIVDFILYRQELINKKEEVTKNELYGVGIMIDKNMFEEDFFFNKENRSIYQKNSKTLLEYAKKLDFYRIYTIASLRNEIYIVNYAYPIYDFSQTKLVLEYSNFENAFIKDLFSKKRFDYPIVNKIDVHNEKLGVIYYPFKSIQNRFVICGEFSYSEINKNLLIRAKRNTVTGVLITFLLGLLVFYIPQTIKKEKLDFFDSVYIDYLTGLPNRKKLFHDIAEINKPVLAIIHVDCFKEINNLYGYRFGDFVIKEMTDRLMQILSKENFKFSLYRLQVDEFAAMIDKDMSIEEIIVMSQYLLENVIKKPLIYKSKEVFVAATMGVAKNEDRKKGNSRSLILKSDLALKRAIQREKNFVLYDESMQIFDDNEGRIDWPRKLKRAINDDRMIPFYQPVINNRTKKIEKFECLIRLIDENKNAISPYFFLDVADRSKSYFHITRIIIKKAFATFKELDCDFAINISINDILNTTTMKLIIDELQSDNNTSKRACFDISESDCIQNYAAVRDFIDKIKQYGASIAIQDFGTSYFNFDNILKLNVDYIKIDSSLIKNISNDKTSQLLTKMIVSFCKELKIKTVSQFVHSREVFDKVCELEVDYSQGYHLGEPQIFPKFE